MYKVVKKLGTECAYCDKAVELLDIRLESYEVEALPIDQLLWVANDNDWSTIPMIFHNGNFIGGYNDLVKYLNDNYPMEDKK